jgi:hypothetical protein
LQRLIEDSTPRDEHAALIEAIIQGEGKKEAIKELQKDQAQTFIDAVDEVYNHPLLSHASAEAIIFVRH